MGKDEDKPTGQGAFNEKAMYDFIDAFARYIVENGLLAEHGIIDNEQVDSIPARTHAPRCKPGNESEPDAASALDSSYPTILKPKEAAELLRVNISTLYPLLAQGKIPGAKKIGGEWRIRRDVLLDWFQGKVRVSRKKS